MFSPTSSYIKISEQEKQQEKEKLEFGEKVGNTAFGVAYKYEVKPPIGESQKKRAKTMPQPSIMPQPLVLDLLPTDILRQITSDFSKTLTYKIRDWIPSDIIDLKLLCANTNITAIKILEEVCKSKGPEKLDWKVLCRNPNAIRLIEEYINEKDEKKKFIEYYDLAYNSSAYKLLLVVKDTDRDNFHWGNFSANSKASKWIVEKSIEEGNMNYEDYNKLFDSEKLNWANVSANRSTRILEFLFDKHPSKVNIGALSGNPNPIAIAEIKKRLVEESKLDPNVLRALPYKDKIDWFLLSANYAAIDILTENRDKIRWDTIGGNESAKDLIVSRIKVEDEYEKEEEEQKRQEDIRNERIKVLKKLIQQQKQQKQQQKQQQQKQQQQKTSLNKMKLPPGMGKQQENLEEELETLKKVRMIPKKEANNRLNWGLICANRKLLTLVKNEYLGNRKEIISKLPCLAANPSIFVLSPGIVLQKKSPSPPQSPTEFRTSSSSRKTEGELTS